MSINKLPSEFVNSVINLNKKNMYFSIKNLNDFKNDDTRKKIFLKKFITRMYGYEGEILMNYSKFTIIKFITDLNSYKNNIKNVKKNTSMIRFVERCIEKLLIYINN